MSNNSWKQYGGLSKIDSLNSIKVGTVVADQIISKSSNPQYQLFNGTIEVTANLIADKDTLIGNSSFIKKDLFVTGNTYANNKLFFGGNQPLLSDVSYVAFTVLPPDSSYSFIYGNSKKIGINTIDPSASFHITGYVQNMLTIETSFNTITNVIGQNNKKRGIVIDVSDTTSSILFFNDISTNIKYNSNGSITTNEPNAYIQYASGGIMKLSTSQGIESRSKYSLITTSGGTFVLNGSNTKLDSSGSILFNTSAGFVLTTSGGLIKLDLDPKSNRIIMGASGDFVMNVSGGNFNLNQNRVFLSSKGSIILNSSGGLFKINSNDGSGDTIIDTSGMYLNAKSSIISSFLAVTTPNNIGRGVSGEMYNATMTLYDNSNSTFLYDVYNDSKVKTGNALTIVAVDPCSNTFLRIVAPKNKMGAAIGGGIYPSDSTRSMAMIGLNDICGNYIPSQTIISGKDPVKYFSTIGINTFSPKVDNYVMDINGPVHIGNGELHNFLNVNFELKTTAFSRSYPKFGIIAGSTSTFSIPYLYYVHYTNDGGITWNKSDPTTLYDVSGFNVSFTSSSMYDSSYGIIGSSKSFLFYTSDSGATWAKIQNYYKNTSNTDTIKRDTGSVKIVRYNNNLRFFNAYRYNNTIPSPYMVDTYTKNIRYFDIPINQLSTKLNGNPYVLNQFTDVSSSINIVASDSSGSYIYFVGSGIAKYNIDDPSYNTNGKYTIQKTDVSYNSVYTYNDNCVIAVGNNVLSYTYDGSGWIDISTNKNNFAGINSSIVNNVILNSIYIYDPSNAIASGDNGTIIYTNNGFDATSWKIVPKEILNTNGIGGSNLTSYKNSLRFVNMPNKSSFVFTNVLSSYNDTTNYGTSYGSSNIIYGFLPNLLDRVNNRVFDVSGNMFVSGDVNVNDGGKFMSNNSNFYILNETVKNIYYGASMETLNIGNNDASTNIYGFTYISRSTHLQGDVSINSRLMVQGDVSFNSRLFVNSDVSLNKRLWVGGDVSLSIRLFVGGDVSLNQRLYTSGDVSFNSRLSVLSDTSLNANFEVLGKSIIRDDISMNKRLFVGGYVNMNSKLYVGSDASINGDLEVFGKTILHDDISIIKALVINGDVSMNSRLSVLSDVSLNAKFEVLGKSIIRDDISMNKRLFIGGDVSMNSRLSILNDVSLNANLGVLGLAVFSNDVSLNRHLFVGRDVSLNKRLYVSGDVSFNSRLSVLSDTSLNGNFEVLGKSVLHDDIYVNRQMYIGADVLFNLKGDYVLQKNLTTNSLNSTVSTIVIDSFAIEWKMASPSIITNKIADWNNTWEGMSASISESGQYCIITASVKTLPILAGIYYSTNYGQDWIQSNITSNAWIARSSSSNGQYAIAIAWDTNSVTTNNVLLSSNYGITWVTPTQILSIQDSKLDTSISGTGQYAIIGSLFYSSDYGNTWKDTVGGSNSSYCVISYSGQYALSGTYGNGIGSLLFSSNYGKNWITPIYSVTNNIISGAWTGLSYPSSNNSSYAIGSNGSGMYYSTDYGYSWRQSNLTTGSFVTSSMSSTGQYAITGIKRSSNYYISSSYGVNWNYIKNSQLYFINNSLAMSGTGQYIIYAGQNGIFYQKNLYTGLIGLGTTPRYPIDINGYTQITGDVSMNSKLSVLNDVSINRNLEVLGKSFIHDDVSMNSRLSVLSDTSLNANFEVLGKSIIRDDISMNKGLFVGGDVSMNSKLYVHNDVSFNKNIQVSGSGIFINDVSINKRLFVGGNVVFYDRVEFAGVFTLPKKTNFSDDTRFDKRIFVLEDVLVGQNLFVLGDVSFNNNFMVNGDVSFNNKLSVDNDVSFNKKLMVNGDVSFNGNVTINGDNIYLNNKNLTSTTMNVINDSILNKRLFVTGDVSINTCLFVGGDVSINTRLFVGGDVSFNKNVRVLGSAIFINDVSINTRLFVGGDVSLNKNLQIFGTTTQNGDVSMNLRLFIGGDVSLNQRLSVVGDVSFNKNIGVLGSAIFINDVSMNTRLFVGGDVSFNKNIGVLGSAIFINDVSINTRLFVGGDVSFNKNIGVLGSAIFVSDVSINRRLFVGGDISLNQRLSVGGDVSLNNRLYVFQDAFFNNRLFANNINLSTTNNIFSMTALTGNTNFSGNQTLTNPNFNIYFSSNNFNITSSDNNPFYNIPNNLDFYIDNPRSNFLLGQYTSNSSISNIYKNNTTYGASYGQSNLNFQNNLAISSNALSNINPINDSTNNIAVGYNSLAFLNGGHCNTSIGSFSMVNLGWTSTGSTFFKLPNNYSLGNNINPDNSTTNFNTSIGYFSMSSKNINISSNKNTVLGALAFADTNISDLNSIVSNGIYTQNTFIGYNAQPMNGVYSNQIVLGTSSESTYIPGKLVVLNDTSLNGNLFVKGDLSFNGRITFSKNAFSNGSIPLLAIADLENSVKTSVASTSNEIISSIQAASIVPTTMPLDGKYSFGTNYQEINNTANIWTNLAMSMTGEYQTALDISANIYYSDNFGESWSKAVVNFPNVTVVDPILGNVAVTSSNYSTSGLFYGIALTMVYSGEIQIASINLRDVNDNNQDVQSYLFLSCNYGVTWNCVYQNTNPKNAQVSSLATSSDGTYMYAAVYRNNPYLYSSDFGGSWKCPTTNNVQVDGNWKAVATSSNGQYVCFGGDGTGLYFSNNSGVQMTILLANKYINSIAMSYSGQYIIVATGSFSPQTPYGTINTSSSNTKNNDRIYLSANFGKSFFAITDAPQAIWLIVKISGNGQYIIAITQSDIESIPGKPGTIWYSYDFGKTWNKNILSASRFWSGAAISSTGQYLTFVSVDNNIITSFTPEFNGSYSNTLSTNNMNISGLLNITGTSAPISLIDGSVLTTTSSPLDYSNNFGTNWNIYASTNSYNFISMSLNGQYQSAVSINYVTNYGTSYSTTYGNIYISNNYGINWSDPTIYISTNSGNTYNKNSGLGWYSISVSGSGQYQYAIPVNTSSYSYSKYIYSSTNYGNTWYISNNNSTLNWTCISCSSSGQYVIAGTKLNYLFLSSTYGINWNITCNINITNPTSKYWNSVSISSSGQYIYTASVSTQSSPNNDNRDTIYISNNFGISWISIKNSSSNNYWQSITCSSNGQYVYACSSSDYNSTKIYDGIYISNDYGNSFAKTNATNTGWKCVSCSSSGKYVIAVSQTYGSSNSNGNIYISIDFGNNWSSINTSSLFNGCAISSDGMYLTACSSTNIYNSVTPYSYIGVSNNFYSYGNNLMIGDVSMNSRLSVLSDVSFSQRLYVGGDVLINGRLNVKSYNANIIISTSTTNYTMIIAEDMSLNGRLYVTGSSSILGNVGIGTNNPTSALTLLGGSPNNVVVSTVTTPNSTAAALFIDTTANTLGTTAGYSMPIMNLKSSVGGNNSILNTYSYRWSQSGTTWTTASTRIQQTIDSINMAYIEFNPPNNNGGIGLYVNGSTSYSGTYNLNASTQGITISGVGNVGIGKTNPAATLDVTGTITASGQITGASFNATSDQRIKTNINDITGKFALDTLRNINPVSYHFIDDSKQKSSLGFIAQEIQKSLENSVSKQTRYIPNIYENIDINNKIITLNKKFTSDISLCDYPVKLQFNDLANNPLYGTIDKIIDSKTFTLIDRLDTSLNKLFLYGQEVNDFLSINYDSVFTVVTSAVKQLDVELQETKQIVKDQSDTINELRTELSELKTQMSNIIRYLNNK